MKKAINLVLLFLIVLVVVAVIPSSLVANRIMAERKDISIPQSSGFWWEGEAERVSLVLRGYRLFLGRVNWVWQPSQIFNGKLCVNFYSYDELLQTEGAFCYHQSSQQWQLSNTQMTISADEIAAISGVEIMGDFETFVSQLTIQGDEQLFIDSDTLWKNAQWYNGEKWLAIGEVLLTARTDKENIIIKSRDVDSPLIIDMAIKFEEKSLHSIDGYVQPKQRVDLSMLATLTLFSQKQVDNRYLFEYQFSK